MNRKKNKIERFKEDVIKLCEQYELSIAHEDGHGNFIIQDFRESNIEWFNNAEDVMINIKREMQCHG